MMQSTKLFYTKFLTHPKNQKKQITGITKMVKQYYRMKIDDKDKLRFRAIKGIQRSEIDKSVDEIYDRDDFVFRLYERSEFKCICYKIFDGSIKLSDLKKMICEKYIELVLKLIDDKMQIVGTQS